MTSASFALQKGVLGVLSSDVALTGLLGGARIFDHVPQRSPMPYLSVGQWTVRDWSTGTEEGAEHLFALHVWSRGSGRREIHEIMQAVRAALEDRIFLLDGHRLVNLRHQVSDARRESDGETYHGIVSMRAVTEPL